jgi:hypothetical protein
MRRWLEIVLFCVLAACLYGEIHDQITAHVCVEYFSVYHPRLIASQSPFALAMVWGVVATWWVGLGVGLVLAAAARAWFEPRWTWRELARPVVWLLTVDGLCALVAGLVGYGLARGGGGRPPIHLSPGLWPRFNGVWCAHQASYGVGFLGAIVVAVWVVFRRARTGLPSGQKPESGANWPQPTRMSR